MNLRRPSSRPLDLQDVIYNIVGGMILIMVGIAGFVILAVILEALAGLAHL